MQRPEVIASTKHLRLVDRNGWSYVERANSTGVVCVVAVTEGKLLLVDQYRPPVNCNVIELPAGLAGDLTDHLDEALEVAAQRELIEETGYRAATLTQSVALASSAGLTNEVVTIFIAEGLQRVAAGGGDESEDIVVHQIPIQETDDWLTAQQASGKLVDSRVYAGLHLLRESLREG